MKTFISRRGTLAATTAATAAVALLTALASPAAFAQTAPRIVAAWARPTVPGQAGGGAYLTITGGGKSDRLLAASAPVSKAVELHSMEMNGNVMRMRAVDAIAVPAGGTVELKPGGLHVMFVGLNQPLKTGTRFPLTLHFEQAGEVKVDVEVMARPPAAAGHAADHKH